MKAWISNVVGIAAGVLLALLLFAAFVFVLWAWITPSPYEQCLDKYIADHQRQASNLVLLGESPDEVAEILLRDAVEACRQLPSGAFDQILW